MEVRGTGSKTQLVRTPHPTLYEEVCLTRLWINCMYMCMYMYVWQRSCEGTTSLRSTRRCIWRGCESTAWICTCVATFIGTTPYSPWYDTFDGVHICIYIYIYIHTHIHTYTCRSMHVASRNYTRPNESEFLLIVYIFKSFSYFLCIYTCRCTPGLASRNYTRPIESEFLCIMNILKSIFLFCAADGDAFRSWNGQSYPHRKHQKECCEYCLALNVVMRDQELATEYIHVWLAIRNLNTCDAITSDQKYRM